LRDQGHEVYAPTLTGLCERSHLASPAINLDTHVTDVVNEIKWKELRDIVLVGHSYGGMVVTGVAEKVADRIASIVYLDAFLPQDGQSLYDIVGGAHPSSGGMVDPLPAEFFAVNEQDRAWVDLMTTSQSEATFTQPLAVSGAAERIDKKTYVRALQGAIPPFAVIYARLSADSGWTCSEIDCGHDVMIDKPDEIARILDSAA
jgi:pimeloyl-ACP methyl ester carboxylesterase